MNIGVSLGKNSYDIILERGVLQKAEELLELGRKTLIVTDSGVPKEYAEHICKACKDYSLVCIEQGEESKNFDNLKMLCEVMLKEQFTRKDCVVAVGGGVVGDLAGFAASCYMRGIDFYNIPTTLLSQVDSSVGGKTAIDLCGVKNIVGAFYQPKAVLVDPDVLATLSEEQFACGAAEIIKMAATFDAELFDFIEKNSIKSQLEEIIARALKIKARVVEEDERESNLRKVLNFGHTLGHGIESVTGLLHGQCVALGMIPMTDILVRKRLLSVLKKENLPTKCHADTDKVIEAVIHDKKAEDNIIVTIQVEKIGNYKLVPMNIRSEERRVGKEC